MAEITFKKAEAAGIRAPDEVYTAWGQFVDYSTTGFPDQMITWGELAYAADHL